MVVIAREQERRLALSAVTSGQGAALVLVFGGRPHEAMRVADRVLHGPLAALTRATVRTLRGHTAQAVAVVEKLLTDTHWYACRRSRNSGATERPTCR